MSMKYAVRRRLHTINDSTFQPVRTELCRIIAVWRRKIEAKKYAGDENFPTSSNGVSCNTTGIGIYCPPV